MYIWTRGKELHLLQLTVRGNTPKALAAAHAGKAREAGVSASAVIEIIPMHC